MSGSSIGRRPVLVGCASAAVASLVAAKRALGFGDVGAFDPRTLLVGPQTAAARPSAPARWAWELMQRTSAPARSRPSVVRADDPTIGESPFLYWSGSESAATLTAAEIQGLRRFFALGGLLFVDDAAPGPDGQSGAFSSSAQRQVERALPDSALIPLSTDHVVFRSFYLLTRAEGRVLGAKTLNAIVRGGSVAVLFSSLDVGGALARNAATGAWEFPVVPGGDTQREHAIRLAVNIAMYVLCSNYKDDQVHAPFLMRRRASVVDEP